MKGIRFYVDPVGSELKPARRSRLTREDYRTMANNGEHVNCIAVLLGKEHRCPDYAQEALVATFAHNDSDVSLGAVSREYLMRCKHIDEATARRLHPRLSARLDSE